MRCRCGTDDAGGIYIGDITTPRIEQHSNVVAASGASTAMPVGMTLGLALTLLALSW